MDEELAKFFAEREKYKRVEFEPITVTLEELPEDEWGENTGEGPWRPGPSANSASDM